MQDVENCTSVKQSTMTISGIHAVNTFFRIDGLMQIKTH